MFGAQSRSYIDRMEEEHDNLRAALEWASSHDPAKAIQLALASGDFWLSRDYNTEAEAWCQPILARSEALTDLAAARARLNAVLAQAAIFMGDHTIARSAAAAGLVLAEQAADKTALVRLYALMGLACMYLGEYPAARQALASGEALARETGLANELAMILILTTQINFFAGGDIEQTKTYAAEAESLTIRAGAQWSNVMLGFAFGRLTGLLGNIEKARALFKQTADAAQRSGNLRVVYSCHSELAHMLRRHGELDEALGLYAEVLPKWKQLGHRSAVAHELECVAFILGQKDQPDRALTLLGAAETIRAEINSAMTTPERAEYDAVISAFHTQVDENKFKQLWDAGHLMNMDQAVDYALEAVRTLS
jgi:tetratricopeptide (TPR) repeat protein